MKSTRSLNKLLSVLAFSLSVAIAPTAWSQGTAFTYQGLLTDSGAPANGLYDLAFTLYDSTGGVTVVGGPLTNNAAVVSNGLFATTLDFGGGIFNGNTRWLEIGVRTNGSMGAFSLLTPRQEFTPTPYALYAPNAGTAVTALNTTAGAVSNVNLAASAVTTDKIADGTITAADVDSASFTDTFWKVDGNTGTTAGTQGERSAGVAARADGGHA